MYSELALLDETFDLHQTHFTGIVGFTCASRPKSEKQNSKNNRVENRTVVVIKRTIDED
ncbi:MAG TPA: hypothetical protein VFT60_01015 [Bryobacteraceae bacterium]|nr:hypothetical protein [Bryobacteraceae bacterium]